MIAGYDPRYLEGVRLFNEREFFAAHDVLEDLWGETLDGLRGYYQGLIHAAVALHHFEEGNLGGARKMYGSCLKYLQPYGDVCLGLDLNQFRKDLSGCFHQLLQASGDYPTGVRLDHRRVPGLMFTPPVMVPRDEHEAGPGHT